VIFWREEHAAQVIARYGQSSELSYTDDVTSESAQSADRPVPPTGKPHSLGSYVFSSLNLMAKDVDSLVRCRITEGDPAPKVILLDQLNALIVLLRHDITKPTWFLCMMGQSIQRSMIKKNEKCS
jgi:hypothetical protein